MDPENAFNLTRQILENLRAPEQLDDHPWAGKLFVRQVCAEHPWLAHKSPGYQLAYAVSEVFRRSMPSAPPRRGKRLDTAWGAFGMLAAGYFAPFLFGEPYPASLRDAWGKIDPSILLFRFGRERLPELSEEDKTRYNLVAGELEVSPLSTLSDWQRKGVELLAEAIAAREMHLELQPVSVQQGAVSLPDPRAQSDKGRSPYQRQRASRRPILGWLLALVVLAVLVVVGIKAYRIYQIAQAARPDLSSARALASLPVDLSKLSSAGAVLDRLSGTVDSLQRETSPWLRPLGGLLRWVPVYGQDLAAAADLLDMADLSLTSVRTLYQTGYPILETLQANPGALQPKSAVVLIQQHQPQLEASRQKLEAALVLLDQYQNVRFSARTQGLLDQVDRPLRLLDDGLGALLAVPRLLGASSEGPKTYMLLVQNQDELRATGGFITSVATLVVKDAAILSLVFEDSQDLDDFSLPYPDSPWQLDQYMKSPVLVLRDANWFADFPTSAGWLEYLYAYKHAHSVDGILAFNQRMLVTLLKVTGPITIPQIKVAISADNVLEYMRETKLDSWYGNPEEDTFIGLIGSALVRKVLSSDGIDWQKLGQEVIQSLQNRDLLLQVDDAHISALLAELQWDGAVRPGEGDFIMVVDSNIGFNKTNAIMQTELTYDVDLSLLSVPTSTLTVLHTNPSERIYSCVPRQAELSDKMYTLDYCHWDYLRVYVPQGNLLTASTPHQIPADWMLRQEGVPARVDTLEEQIAGVQGFGTLVVIPGGQSRSTRFEFSLPAGVVTSQPGTNTYTYTLKVQKQAGTNAIPLMLRIHLPGAARVQSTSREAALEGSSLLVQADLRADFTFSVLYSLP